VADDVGRMPEGRSASRCAARLRRQPAVDVRDLARQRAHVLDQAIVHGTVHVGGVIVGLAVDGDAEGMDLLPLGLDGRAARVLDAGGAARVVPVVGLAVGQGDEQAGGLVDRLRQMEQESAGDLLPLRAPPFRTGPRSSLLCDLGARETTGPPAPRRIRVGLSRPRGPT